MCEISVIIPTYNVEKFIGEALDSIMNQTCKEKKEIIIVDDCSTDDTLTIVKEYQERYGKSVIKIFLQPENKRQGTARNRGVREAKGKYVLFLDGDDMLDPNTFEELLKKAEKTNYDLIVFDWEYYSEEKGFVHVNKDKFLSNDELKGEECERLLEAATYFTVNKLYNRQFLMENNITYGEGYIYEDYEFYMKIAQKANNIGIVREKFYKVRLNEYSTTKTNRKSMIHIESFLKAVENTVKDFEPRSQNSYYFLYKYIVKKSLSYGHKRAPIGQKRKTLKRTLEIINKKETKYAVPKKLSPFFHYLFKRKYVQNARISKILFIYTLHRKGKLKKFHSTMQFTKKILFRGKVIAFLNKK